MPHVDCQEFYREANPLALSNFYQLKQNIKTRHCKSIKNTVISNLFYLDFSLVFLSCKKNHYNLTLVLGKAGGRVAVPQHIKVPESGIKLLPQQ